MSHQPDLLTEEGSVATLLMQVNYRHFQKRESVLKWIVFEPGVAKMPEVDKLNKISDSQSNLKLLT